MAYERHRTDSAQASQGQQDSKNQSDPRYQQQSSYSSNHSGQGMTDLEKQRIRDSPTSAYDAEYKQARQPIDQAVSSAFSADPNNAIPPDVLSRITSQITQNVMEQLKAAQVAIPSPMSPSDAPPALSPTTTGSPQMDHRKVYTPPSPYRASEEAAQTPISPIVYSSVPKANDASGRSMSPFSQDSQTDDSDAREEQKVRPKGPKRLSTASEATTLEKIWGTLFDEEGHATNRLAQFLRGIAVHLIEDYEPKHSLVVTPQKMRKYYEDTRLASEIYPWEVVFDDETSSISRLYRELEAQHHLVQEKLDQRPELPGLTPLGFERWVTLLLVAHPNLEFERLQKTALDMPISNPDDRRERFPKELSRRLFPKLPDAHSINKLKRAIAEHCKIKLESKRESFNEEQRPPPRPSHRAESIDKTSPKYPPPVWKNHPEPTGNPGQGRPISPPAFPGMERQRQPYSDPPSEGAVEDEDDVPTPQPIERERKPYVAQPGGGKTYDGPTRSNTMDYNAPVPEGKLDRSASMTSQGRPNEIPKPRPAPISVQVHQRGQGSVVESPAYSGESRHHRTNSTYHRERDLQSRSTRLRSPSATSSNGREYGHRSEGDVNYGSKYPNDVDNDARRYRDYERERERFASDRFDAARMSAYNPQDRERESRARFQSSAGFSKEESDYHRPPASGGSYQASFPQYPPNSYR